MSRSHLCSRSYIGSLCNSASISRSWCTQLHRNGQRKSNQSFCVADYLKYCMKTNMYGKYYFMSDIIFHPNTVIMYRAGLCSPVTQLMDAGLAYSAPSGVQDPI